MSACRCNDRQRRRRDEGSIALVSVILLVLLMGTAVVVDRSLSSSRQVRTAQDRTAALAALEVGTADAVAQLNLGRASSFGSSGQVAGATWSYQVAWSSVSTASLTATGASGAARRTMVADLTRTGGSGWIVANRRETAPLDAYRAAVLDTSGLIGYWPLDETSPTSTATDASGDAANGSASNLTDVAPPIVGGSGTAKTFNGTSASVTVPDTSSAFAFAGTSSFSVGVWVKAASTATVPRLVGRGTAADGWSLWLDGPNSRWSFIRSATTSTEATAPATWNQWTFLVGTYDGTSERLYVNGTLLSTTTSATSLTASSASLTLGVGASSNWLSGSLDEPAVWNRPLASTEIARLYNVGLGQPQTAAASYASTVLSTPGLAAYWRLGEASGTAALDTSGNGQNLSGTITFGRSGALAHDTDTAGTFNGTSSVLSGPDALDFAGSAPFTAVAWVNPAAYANNPALVGKEPSTRGGWYLRLGPSTGALALVRIPVGDNGSNADRAISSTLVSLDRWTFVAGTFDGTTMKVYVDGVQTGSAVAVRSLPDTSEPVSLGHVQSGPAYFSGGLDEVAVWSRALDATEIAGLYAAGTS